MQSGVSMGKFVECADLSKRERAIEQAIIQGPICRV